MLRRHFHPHLSGGIIDSAPGNVHAPDRRVFPRQDSVVNPSRTHERLHLPSASPRTTRQLRPLSHPGCLALLLLLLLAPLAPLHAQLTKIFVSATGNDANDGARGTPKRTFQAAHDAVAPAGEIVALDTAGFGAVVITKSLGITVPTGINGFITAISGNGITINAGSSDVVTLRGLSVNSPGGASTAVLANGVGTLEMTDCTLSGFETNGLSLATQNTATLLLKNCTIRDSNNGILVPTSVGVPVTMVIDDCQVQSNRVGLNLATNSQAHRVVLHNTAVINSAGGFAIAVRVNGGSNQVTLQGCTISASGIGIDLVASGATARLDGCTIAANTLGLSRVAGANLLSRGNNTLEGNTTDGIFSGTYTAK